MVAETCGDTGTVVLNTTLRQSLTLKTVVFKPHTKKVLAYSLVSSCP